MTTKNKVIAGIVAAIGLLVLGYIGFVNTDRNAGAASVNEYKAGIWWFGNGLFAGTDQQFSVDANGYVDTSGQIRSTATSSTINGVTAYYGRQSTLNTASTTACSLQSPNATTTLPFGGFTVNLTTGSTTVKQVILAKGTAMNASTTVLGNTWLAANAKATSQSTTTTYADLIIAPNTWFNVSLVGGTGVDSPAGACTLRLYSTI